MFLKKALSLSLLLALAGGAFVMSEQAAEAGRCGGHRRCCNGGYGYSNGYGYGYGYGNGYSGYGNCCGCSSGSCGMTPSGGSMAPAPAAPAPAPRPPRDRIGVKLPQDQITGRSSPHHKTS